MANFPAIRCSSIIPLPGSFPGRRNQSVAGNVASFQRMNRATGAEIRLAFRGISDAEVATLRAHWDGEQRLGRWQLPSVILDVLPHAPAWAAAWWRYKARPNVVDRYANCHDVEMELELAPVTPWIDRVLIIARPGVIAFGSAARLIGPDTPPAIWVSRLTTNGNISSGNYRAEGNIAIDTSGNSWQAFWFTEAGQDDARIVVVKRDPYGVILRQWWTATTVGAPNAGITSFPPAVIPLSAGGCVVAAKISTDILTNPPQVTRLWRLNDDGTQAWASTVSATIGGPVQVAEAAGGSEIILGTNAYYGGSEAVALVRINAANGNYINGRMFYIDSTTTETRGLYVLPSGSILINARHTSYTIKDGKRFYLLQVSPNLATVEQVHGYGTLLADGPVRAGGNIVRAATGELLVPTLGSNGAGAGLLRLSADYAVAAHNTYLRTTPPSGSLSQTVPISLAIDGTGNTWMLSNWSTFGFKGASLLAMTDRGSGVDYTTDMETEQDASTTDPLGAKALQIDSQRQRVVFSTFSSVQGYVATAQGYAMGQASSATILDIGGGRDVKAQTTDPAPGVVTTGPVITRYGGVTVVPVNITGTNPAGAIAMVDASALLSWTLHRKYV